MPSAGKPWWQQATALVSLGAGGAVTGFSFIPRPAADLTSPSGMPVHLMALEQSARPAAAGDGALRSAIVNVANYYRRMAESKTPAEMEAVIWQRDSVDGANHGASCAAFASLTLELGAHVTGQQSWVTGGSTYPWPLHDWVDARVNPNPASPGITSIVQDAQAHDRWHALGDGYQPLPGDWVVFDGHVEVVTGDADGVLATIGGDSLPNFSVNAHEYPGPLAAHGVMGFVDNGALPSVAAKAAAGRPAAAAGGQPNKQASSSRPQRAASAAAWAPTGLPAADIPAGASGSSADTAVIPGLPIMAHRLAAHQKAAPAPGYRRHDPSPAPKPVHDVGSQQAFIREIAPGAIAAQRKYGVPASVTIAQAIDESGWGKSTLATRDHNLFGIKGTGPAGTTALPTQEYQNGQLVTGTHSFRVYHSTAQSIDDHGKLLATSGYYRQSMADRRSPNAFAQSLTGIYATDPSYGAKLISLMQQYDLYRYDVASPAARPQAATPEPALPATTIPGLPVPGPSGMVGTTPPAASPTRTAGTGQRSGSHPPEPTPAASGPTAAAPAPSPAPSGPGPSEGPSGAASAAPAPVATPAGPTPTARPSAPARPTPSARPTPVASAQPTSRSAPPPAPSSPAPEGPPSAGPAQDRPSAAPSGPTPTAAAPSPSLPGMPAAATEPPGGPPSAQIPAGEVPVADPPHASPSAAAHAGEAPALAPHAAAAPIGAATAALTIYAGRMAAPARRRGRRNASRHAYKPASRYQQQIPPAVKHAFVSTAKVPLLRAEPLYQDVASHSGISWELLAACDWMQCEARARYSPVHGEKLGAVNADGTTYHTKSEALEQCAEDLVELAETVYGIDLTADGPLSVRDLANAFAAFRWGGLLRLHRTSAMEFPYSVAGLTPQHVRMRWPRVADPNTPDRPGSRFRRPFGAVPIVLSLNYPATV
ncbi:MAG TPA: glucosaminidase domain-containing protein [Streptosporangiaceae bacterium]